jgi:hypothetical protein
MAISKPTAISAPISQPMSGTLDTQALMFSFDHIEGDNTFSLVSSISNPCFSQI